MATIAEIRAEAYSRAVGGMSTRNYAAIVEGFMARGIPADQIEPRVNVFTYRAWQEVGRQVRKGEKGVSVLTFAPGKSVKVKDESTGEVKRVAGGGRRPWHTTVFHVSQTDPIARDGEVLERLAVERKGEEMNRLANFYD